MGDYQRLHTDADAAEVVPPIEPKIPRTVCQKTLFVLSISSLLALIVFFLWGLPCDIRPCNAPQRASWDKTIYGIGKFNNKVTRS